MNETISSFIFFRFNKTIYYEKRKRIGEFSAFVWDNNQKLSCNRFFRIQKDKILIYLFYCFLDVSLDSSSLSTLLNGISPETGDPVAITYQIELYEDEDGRLLVSEPIGQAESAQLVVTLSNLTANTRYRIRLLTLVTGFLDKTSWSRLPSWSANRKQFQNDGDDNDKIIKDEDWKIFSNELIKTVTLSEMPYFGSFHNRNPKGTAGFENEEEEIEVDQNQSGGQRRIFADTSALGKTNWKIGIVILFFCVP